MVFPPDQTLISVEESRSPANEAAPEAPAHWADRAMGVIQELIALRDPARRETRWRIAVLTLAVFASLC